MLQQNGHELLTILFFFYRYLSLQSHVMTHDPYTMETALSVGVADFSSLMSHSSPQAVAPYHAPMAHHYTKYNEDTGMHARALWQASESSTECSWNSYDNVPPTPAPASPYDADIEGQDYRIGYDSDYHQDAVALGAPESMGATGSGASPRPTTPMGALTTPPSGYEWYISPAYEAYLVPLAETSSDSTHGNATSISLPIALAPYGLPTPPLEADADHGYSRESWGRRGLPEWIAANPGRELVDVLNEELKDLTLTRTKASRR